MGKAKPSHVIKAMKEGDVETLRRAQKASVRSRMTNIDIEKAFAERRATAARNDEFHRWTQSGEHIIPLNVYD